jgi:hypothetical protein
LPGSILGSIFDGTDPFGNSMSGMGVGPNCEGFLWALPWFAKVSGAGGGGGAGRWNVTAWKKGFYYLYGAKLNNCIQQIFGASSKVAIQSITNSPSINLNYSSTSLAKTFYPEQNAIVGWNNPTVGTYGVVYIATDYWNTPSQKAGEVQSGTYIHELGNTLNYDLNGSETTFGDSSDPVDRDTGERVEKCVFDGVAQYP